MSNQVQEAPKDDQIQNMSIEEPKQDQSVPLDLTLNLSLPSQNSGLEVDHASGAMKLETSVPDASSTVELQQHNPNNNNNTTTTESFLNQSTSTPSTSSNSAVDESQLENGTSQEVGSPDPNATSANGGATNPISPMMGGQRFVDITEFLNMPQTQAAKQLGVPTSTLSKRWKEAVRNRKWPYRTIRKLDKEITTLLHNVPQGPGAPPLPEDIEHALAYILRKRQGVLRPVIIRI